ncbi:EAL and HDOD domain-containing protein [[Enterobacter] lignolyticus]|uniref:Diguanylate phosphodiesterase n=1 Tax=[Enterobacter] lignolyticus TaxID=1334193 RepID=A0A806X4T8_9ENTR|nr:EAL domain-containing protein [[Enterobacter] lignolyticus]ALR76780.1 diguanylate phosphodiesterase [[Enterobacter] lignolyticus]
MYAFTARQPIFDRNMKTVAYELLFRDGMENRFPDVSAEYATSRMISDQFLCIPSLRITGSHTAYINFPAQMIVNRCGEALPNDRVVIELLEESVPGAELLQAVKAMHARGACFALDDCTLSPDWDAFLPYVSVIKFDIRKNTPDEIFQYINERKPLLSHIQFLAEKVETQEEYRKYRAAGFSLFQGFFFCKPEIIKNRRLSHNQLTIFRLQMEVSRHNLDFPRIEALLKTDLTLSYKIMRYMKHIVCKQYGVCNFNKLTLKEILMYLGEDGLRRFVAVVALANLSNDSVSELYHLSMVRGKFCELMAGYIGKDALIYSAFLTGLFSLLETILEFPMEELIKQVAVPPDVSEALCGQPGILTDIVSVCRYYEQLDWESASKISEALGITAAGVTDAMKTATEWARDYSVF